MAIIKIKCFNDNIEKNSVKITFDIFKMREPTLDNKFYSCFEKYYLSLTIKNSTVWLLLNLVQFLPSLTVIVKKR